MLIVAPDFARRIDLPGAGPCPRPIDIDRARSGLTALVSLRIYSFAAGMVIDGEAEEDEVFIVLMRGQASIGVDIDGDRAADVALDTEGGARAVYLPPHAAYQLSAATDCDIAYARTKPSAPRFPDTASFTPKNGALAVAEHAIGMAMTLTTRTAGETFALVGADGRAPERFVHIRTDDGAARLAGQPLSDWHAAVFGAGEMAALEIERGTADVLVIAARPT